MMNIIEEMCGFIFYKVIMISANSAINARDLVELKCVGFRNSNDLVWAILTLIPLK